MLLLGEEDGRRTTELVLVGLAAAAEQPEGAASLLLLLMLVVVVVVDVDLRRRDDDVRRLSAVDRRPEAVVPSDDAVAKRGTPVENQVQFITSMGMSNCCLLPTMSSRLYPNYDQVFSCN